MQNTRARLAESESLIIEAWSNQSGRGLIAASHPWFSFSKRNRHGKDASQYSPAVMAIELRR